MRSLDRRGDADGFTLVELAVTLAVMAVIIVTIMPVVQIFYDESLAVQRTYNGADEALLTSEGMTRYIREMVEPARDRLDPELMHFHMPWRLRGLS